MFIRVYWWFPIILGDELFGFARCQCDAEWSERDPARLRALFHQTEKPGRPSEVHDRGVCDVDAVPDLLPDLSRKSRQNGLVQKSIMVW